MKDRHHIVNAEKLGITVTSYLILEYMHYYDIHLNFYNPKGIGYIGLNEKLFRHNVAKVLVEKKYVKKKSDGISGDFELTSSVKQRMSKMVGDKKTIETLFNDQFMAAYPNKTGQKAALASFMKLPFNDSSNVIQDILDAIEARKEWIKKAPPKAFIAEWPMPATYLNGERWKDVLTPWPEEQKESVVKYIPNQKEVL